MPIYKTDNGYKIKNTKGKSKTKSEAIKRLRAIKADKNDEVIENTNYNTASRRPNNMRDRKKYA